MRAARSARPPTRWGNSVGAGTGPALGVAVAASVAIAGLAAPAPAATELSLPDGAKVTSQATTENGSLAVAKAGWNGTAVPLETVEGAVGVTTWRIDNSVLTTLDLLAPVRADLMADGYSVLFECTTEACGGFDFRYSVPVAPEPEMHVDLGDFRYLAARREGPGGAFVVAVLVSRSNENGFVQISSVTPKAAESAPLLPGGEARAGSEEAAPKADPAGQETTQPDPGVQDFAGQIERDGTVALDDLVFPSGSAQLGPGDFPSLRALAAYLAQHPDARVTLVGHTDAEGALAANVALSRRRAQSVADRLVNDLGVRRGQISAEGVGFLAPRATNLTPEGRTKNRRVEAMLASTR